MVGEKMKTTLCDSCKFGLIREWDCYDEKCKERHISKKCLVGNDELLFPITSCNRYKKASDQVTYHDPDFDKFEAAMDEAEDRVKEKTLEVL
jgi:RNase P subunit RPR2